MRGMRMVAAVRALLVVGLLGWSTTPACADWSLTPWVGVNFGGNANFGDVGDFSDNFEKKAVFGGTATWMSKGIVGVEADFGWAPNFFSVTTGSAPFDFGDGNLTTLMGNVVVGVPVGGQHGPGVRPYGVRRHRPDSQQRLGRRRAVQRFLELARPRRQRRRRRARLHATTTTSASAATCATSAFCAAGQPPGQRRRPRVVRLPLLARIDRRDLPRRRRLVAATRQSGSGGPQRRAGAAPDPAPRRAVVRQDEERAAVRAAEAGAAVGRSGTSMRPTLLAVAAVDEDLAVGDVDVAGRVRRRRSRRRARRTRCRSPSVPSGLTTARDRCGSRRRSSGRRARPARARDEAVGVERVRPAPAGRVHAGIGVVGSLAEDAPGGQEQAAVRRHVFLRLRRSSRRAANISRQRACTRSVVEVELVGELAVVPHVDGEDRARARMAGLRGCGWSTVIASRGPPGLNE